MALFLLAHAVDRVAGVDVDHAVASDPVHRVTSVDVDHAVASDPVDRTSSIDLNPTRHAPIVAARARKVEQGASYRREKASFVESSGCHEAHDAPV
jgi:hypothetical protein